MFFEAMSASMRAVEAIIRELAQSEVPVLLLGETGSGKRVTAERIHEMSSRGGQPFQVADAFAVTPEDLEVNSEGFFHGRTVFLAEIKDLKPPCQAKLLGILPQCGENGHAPEAGARIIFGSATDLEAEVRSGRFREDLYYRISGVCLQLPPLRQRKEDIPYLISHFLNKYSLEFRLPAPVLTGGTQSLLQDYGWPGNVRELQDVVKAIVVLGDEEIAMRGLRSLLLKSGRVRSGERISLKQAARAASREAERELILKALTRTRWNRRRAAQELQISYKALLYKLKQIGCGGYEAR